MTDKYVRETQHKYTANASLVVNRGDVKVQSGLPSGESESLKGRRLHTFGDLVSKEANPELK